MKTESTNRTPREGYWKNEYRKARKEAEFHRHWSEVYLFLLGIATFAIIYLLKYGG